VGFPLKVQVRNYAQQNVLVVNVPFAFQAGNHTLPAGKYRVDSALSGTEAIQRLRQVDDDAVIIPNDVG
jgi:CheY-like chemotaxis protein